MQVLLVANHARGALEPVCGELSLAELPVVGRSVLERALEGIAPLAPERVTVAASAGVVGIRAFVSGGERWGLDARVVAVRAGDEAPGIVGRVPGLAGRDVLALPCDRLYDLDLEAALGALRERSGGTTRTRCRASGLEWFPANAAAGGPAELELPVGAVLPIDSPVAYHRAASAVSRGDHPRLSVAGRQRAIGLRQGYMTSVHPGSVESGHAFVGNHCRVHHTCRLAGTVVLADGVSVGRMTRVENAVVLGNTVIGEHLDVRDAIVSGDTIVRVDSGAVLRISDRFLLCRRGAGLFGEYLSPLSNRLVGAALLIGSAPAILLGATVATARRGRPFVARRLVGNRRDAAGEARAFTARSLALDAPVLRRLPMLLAVVSGDLRMVGVAPLSPEEAEGRTEGWQSVRDRAPAGLLGPTQLYLGMDAPLEERLLSDAVVARTGVRGGAVARLVLDATRCLAGLGGRDRAPAPTAEL